MGTDVVDPILFGDRRASADDLSSGTLRVEESLLIPGDLALLADSMNQCFMEAS